MPTNDVPTSQPSQPMQPNSTELDAQRISRVIFNYAAKIGGEQDTDQLLRLNADMARDLVAADRCSIWLVDSETKELWTKIAHGVKEIRVPLGSGLVGACVKDGQTILVNDTASDPRFLGRVDRSSGYVTSSVLVIPLHGPDGAIIGAFQALNKPGGFAEADVQLLGLAASYSAAAIETQRLQREAEAARLLYHDLEIARDVQMQLLPRDLPALRGVDVAAYFRPAKFVGGDYYDAVPLPGSKLALTLGDVSGKGIPAAVLMASIQSTLRAQVAHASDSLADMMNNVNQVVSSYSGSGRYSTLFCMVLDLETQDLTYVNAGQISPLWLHHSGGEPKIERLTTGGLPIGLLKQARYDQQVVQLAPGDMVLCFSDGINEASRADGEMWGELEAARILRESAGLSAAEAVDRVIRAADAFTAGAEQYDDMTALLIRRLDSAPEKD